MTDSQKLDLILKEIAVLQNGQQKTNAEVAEIKTELQETRAEVAEIKTGLQETRAEVAEIKTELQETRAEVAEIKTELQETKADVTGIKLTIENEIRVNIQRIAEGHLDLSRNLHEAMKPNNEVEMLAIKVRALESEVRDIKAKIS